MFDDTARKEGDSRGGAGSVDRMFVNGLTLYSGGLERSSSLCSLIYVGVS